MTSEGQRLPVEIETKQRINMSDKRKQGKNLRDAWILIHIIHTAVPYLNVIMGRFIDLLSNLTTVSAWKPFVGSCSSSLFTFSVFFGFLHLWFSAGHWAIQSLRWLSYSTDRILRFGQSAANHDWKWQQKAVRNYLLIDESASTLKCEYVLDCILIGKTWKNLLDFTPWANTLSNLSFLSSLLLMYCDLSASMS